MGRKLHTRDIKKMEAGRTICTEVSKNKGRMGEMGKGKTRKRVCHFRNQAKEPGEEPGDSHRKTRNLRGRACHVLGGRIRVTKDRGRANSV